VDLLGVFDQPFQQWWWLVPEVLTEPVEHELGLRTEGGAQRSGETTISSSARWITSFNRLRLTNSDNNVT